MLHPIVERFADLLIRYCTEVRPGDTVSLNLDTPAEPLVRALYGRVLAAGGRPLLRLSYPDQLLDLLEQAPDSFFDDEPTLDLEEIRAVDAWIRVRAPNNKRNLQEVDKLRYNRYQKRQQPVQQHRLDHTRWVGSLYPTEAGAQDAGMSLATYQRFVYRSMFLFDDDPAARWRDLAAFQARLIERLAGADEVHIVAAGTDLRLRVGGRTWINSDGRKNMPSGEVFTGPHETSAEGTITFGVPSSVQGMQVAGVRLRFEGGEVVESSAEQGGDLLLAQLASDGGARRVGELGIGTNFGIDRATLNTLFDEKIGGTVHLALGRSYPSTGGLNDSAIHWDLVCDLRQGGAIYLDGEPFQQNGHFVV